MLSYNIFRRIRRLIPFPIRVEYFRMRRTVSGLFSADGFAEVIVRDLSGFPYEVFSHRTRLIREYPDPWYTLQFNKITNLKLAISKLNGTVLPTGKKFSFWKIVGRTSKRKGYREGMTLIDGHLSRSIGGGLCQLSNSLYWTALNLGFEVVERHRHSFDIFPDMNRTVPFGSGATIFYNYVDLIFGNNSDINYIFEIYLDDEYLNVKVYADREPLLSYKVVEENHRFLTEMGRTFRENELYRLHIDDKGTVLRKELICKNRGLVLYECNKGNAKEAF